MSQSHMTKSGTTDEAFKEQCFIWERWASGGVDTDLFNSQDIQQAQEPKLNTEGKITEKLP